MTTPNGGWPAPDGGSLLGGAGGTLGGTNNLQSAIDTLDTSINKLTQAISAWSNNNNGGMGSISQQSGNGGGFPRMINPFGRMQQAGIGGGGPGGVGNIAPIATFSGIGLAAGAYGVARMGQGMMQNQLTMNAYAFNSQLAGVGQATTFRQAYGVNNSSLSAISTGAIDATIGAQMMQYLAGSPVIGSTALGRAGFGAAASFGYSNPTLSLAQSAGLAQQIYSPQVAQALMMSGMGFSRMPGSGMPVNSAALARSLIQNNFMNGRRGFVSSRELNLGLGMGGRFNASLQAAGLNPTAMSPYLNMYNTLFRQGVSTSQAQSLVTAAASGNTAAQGQLGRYGIQTSDIQKLKNVGAQTTNIQAELNSGFNNGLSEAASLLTNFNKALGRLLNGPLGYGAGSLLGFGGVMGGGLGGAIGGAASGLGSAYMWSKILGVGGEAGAGGLAGGLAGKLGLGGAASLAARAIPAAAFLAFATGYHGFGGKSLWGMFDNPSQPHSMWGQRAGTPGANPMNSWGQVWNDIFGSSSSYSPGGRAGWGNGGGVGSMTGNSGIPGGRALSSGGGPAPLPPQRSSSGGSSSRVLQIIMRAAKSEVGDPYVWGGNAPGAKGGFDCSGLVYWAYGLAGIRLPRTAATQYFATKNKSVNMNNLQPGDLLFAAGSDGTAASPGHVGIYIGNGQVIQAYDSQKGIIQTPLNYVPWLYATRPAGIGSGGGASASKSPNGGGFGAANIPAAIPGIGGGSPGSGIGGTGNAGMGAVMGGGSSMSPLAGLLGLAGNNNSSKGFAGASSVGFKESSAIGGLGFGSSNPAVNPMYAMFLAGMGGLGGIAAAGIAGATSLFGGGGNGSGSISVPNGTSSSSPPPSVGGKAILPAGSGNQLFGQNKFTPNAWAQAILNAGKFPNSRANQQSLIAWALMEGGGGAYNPLNSALPWGGSSNFNNLGGGQGVQNYGSWKAGIAATVATMRNGFYPSILADLMSGHGIGANAGSNLHTWSGSGGYTGITGTWARAGGYMPRATPHHGLSSTALAQLQKHMRLGFGSGGQALAGSWGLVGENGPELVRFNSPTQVYNSSQSAGMMTRSSGGRHGGPHIHLNFPPNAIQIQMNGTGSDATNAARQVAQQVVNQLSTIQTARAIQKGMKL